MNGSSRGENHDADGVGLPGGGVLLDGDGSVTDVLAGDGEWPLESPAEDAVGSQLERVVPGSDRKRVARAFDAAVAAGEPRSVEVTGSGDPRVRVRVLPAEGEGPVAALATVEAVGGAGGTPDRRPDWLQAAFEDSSEGIVLHDTDGEIDDVNDALLDLLGYSREQLLSMNVEEFEAGFTPDRLREVWSDLSVGETFEGESRLRRRDGEVVPVETRVTKIDLDGDHRLVAFVRETATRKAKEEALRRRERQFRSLFEHHSAPMLLVDPDTGRIRRANEAATEFYGYSAERLGSMEIQEINRLPPGEVARERDRAESEDRNHFVFEHELADGEVRTVEVHSSPIEFGDEELLFSIVHDVTDRVEYERELERHKELVENVPVGIYRTTAEGEGSFVEVNPAMVELFDADSAEQLLDRPVADLYADPDDRERFVETLREDGVVREMQLELRTLSGETFCGSVTAIATDDSATYVDGVVVDVTERKEYERRLEEQRDSLEVLNRMVRHDIRNDLQVVGSYADLLTDHVDEEARSYVEEIEQSARNGVDLTTTARDLAETVLQTDADREPVPLVEAVQDPVEEIRSTYGDADVTIEGSIPGRYVLADEMLESVFRNLLKNAVQHNDTDHPEVTVSATETDDGVVVRVADDGPGIPDDRKEEVFGEGEKGPDSQGTGMGLYLVATLVDRYDGEVRVEDNDPRGAVFEVELAGAG